MEQAKDNTRKKVLAEAEGTADDSAVEEPIRKLDLGGTTDDRDPSPPTTSRSTASPRSKAPDMLQHLLLFCHI